MKRRLFKKFKRIDYNDYYYANINGEHYYGVATNHFYKEDWLGLKIARAEEQFFMSAKIPLVISVYLAQMSRQIRGTAEGAYADIDFEFLKEDTKTDLISSIVEGEEAMLRDYPDKAHDIQATYAKQYDSINSMFFQDWENPLITDYLSKKWHFVYQQYAGKATRDIWLARRYADVTTILQIKLFGNGKDNEVVDIKRILMDDNTLVAFVDKMTEAR